AVTTTSDPLPCGLASSSCAGVEGSAPSICVDDLYQIDDTCDPNPDPTFAHFTALPPANDYHAPLPGGAPDATLCFTIDKAGNVLLRVAWRGVLVKGEVPIARVVSGGTKVGRSADDQNPIRVPSHGFLGSYPPAGSPLPPVFEPQRGGTALKELAL